MNAMAMQQQDYGMGGQQMAPSEPEREYMLWSLDKKVNCFEDAEEASYIARGKSEKCRDYYDNKQLTAAELAELASRGQPDIIINRIQSKVNYLLGYEATLRTDPRGLPRNPADEDAADACTDALNYVRDTSDQKQCFSQCWENMLIEGAGGSEIIPSVRPGDATIKIKRAHWDRVYWDPHSREYDFSDARYLGTVIWMDQDDALAQWPDAKDAIENTISDEAKLTYGDRPHWRQWATVGAWRKRVRIVQMYYKCRSKDGQDECWHWCIFTKGGEIESGMVPYRDDDEEKTSLCPLILQSAYVTRDNERYGFVQALIGPQDEINKRRSKMLHEASVRQFQYEKGAVDDPDLTKRELAKPDGGIETNPGFEFNLLDRSKELSAHASLQAEAKQEIELMGPNSAMLGKGGGDPSGRAILANQSGGQIEIAPLVDRHNHYKSRVHRLVWAMIRMYWTEEKWIRVTDDEDRSVRFVGFNRPKTMAEVLLEQADQQGVPLDEAKAKLRDAAQNPMLAAQLQQVVKIDRVPADMGMDIILDEIPDVANLQQEQFRELTDLSKAGVPLPPTLLIKASSLRNKKELLEELDKSTQDPTQQAAIQMQLAKAKADLDKITAEMDKMRADTAKIMAEIENTRANSVKTLAEADAVDKQFGTVIDPTVVNSSRQPEASPQAQQSSAMPMAAPPQQNPLVSQAISDQAASMQPQGGPMPMDQGMAQQPMPDQMMPQPQVPDIGSMAAQQGFQ